MGLFDSIGTKAKRRVAREAENWRSPRTMGGQNISLVEAGYYGLVLVIALILAGFAQKSSMGQVLVFGAAVVALSTHVRRATIPALYDLVAPKLGWASFKESIAAELKADPASASGESPKEATQSAQALPGAEPATHPAEAPVPATEPDSQSLEVLRVFAGLTQTDRRARSLQVVEFLRPLGKEIPGIDAVADEHERRIVAEFAIMDLARREGVA